MQKPLAEPGMAWCRPPETLTACVFCPVHTRRTASSVAPAISALASCMPPKTGLSSVPSPTLGSAWVGCTDSLRTFST